MPRPNEALKRVLFAMFESWAMMLPDEEPYPAADPDARNGEMRHVSVSFEGLSAGLLELWLGDDLARELAANVLGIADERDVTDDKVDDALRELGNLLCGHFLTTNFGNQQAFRFGLPCVDARPADGPGRDGKVRLMIEGKEVLGSVSFLKGGV